MVKINILLNLNFFIAKYALKGEWFLVGMTEIKKKFNICKITP